MKTRYSFGIRRSAFVTALWLMCAAGFNARGVLQFDVFLGYDGVVPEASWFPVVCEVKNDGPPFTATVEIAGGNLNQGQTRRMEVELPTGTLKRLVIPVFSSTRGYSSWDVRLLDERGKVRSEQINMRPTKQLAANTPLIGGLPRTATGMPGLRSANQPQSELQPTTARLQPSIFPDNPLVLEGLSALYLNSERALELGANQVNALYHWLNAGGHLIIAVEQLSDITSTPWLKSLYPCDLTDMQTFPHHPELQDWVRNAVWPTNLLSAPDRPIPGRKRPNRPGANPGAQINPPQQLSNPFSELTEDPAFEAASVQVAVGSVREGRVMVTLGDNPMIVTASRGRGRVTALMFSPEREPFRSWKNLPGFWSRLIEAPAAGFITSNFGPGGWSSDGIFGAMIDTKQVHKLPVGWLLLLLMVYLVVIGPFDQFWLKRIGRPMLTWITFPCYVVLFSLLIYFIGYKLRAGESEWNELHLVDVLLNGDRAELRGRTYASVYSPANQRYELASQQKIATLRGEFVGAWGGGQSSEKASVLQDNDTFKAEIFVPVWTSQLFVSDWWQPAVLPIALSVTAQGDAWQVGAENRTDHSLANAQIVLDGYLIPVGDLPPHQPKTVTVNKGQGTALRDFVWSHGQTFQNEVQSRQHAFGARESGRISDLPNGTIAASFLSQMAHQQNYMNNFIAPPGLDLSATIERGNAVLFAWAADYSPIKPINLFSPRRSHRDTLWRVTAPIQ